MLWSHQLVRLLSVSRRLMSSLSERYRGELLCPRVRSEGLFPSTWSLPLTAYYRYPFDRVRKLFDINVHGVYLTAREAARLMIPNGGGSIILIASMSASVSPIRFPIGMACT